MTIPAVDQIREFLEEAEEGVLQTILAEQDPQGKWLTRRGNFVQEPNSNIASGDSVENIGLHAFIVELLLTNWLHVPGVRLACIRGVAQIVLDAIPTSGHLFWRWLKNPTRSDFYYPNDYDDTSRATATLAVAKRILTSHEWSQATAGLDIFETFNGFAKSAAEDLNPLDDKFQPVESLGNELRAVFTFQGGFNAKSDNTIDPIVNANILYAIAVCEPLPNGTITDLSINIKRYLIQVIRKSHLIFPHFSDFSHYYLSSWFFAYLCAKIYRIAPKLMPLQLIDGMAKNLLANRVHCRRTEEAAWALFVLATAGGLYGDREAELAEKIMSELDPSFGISTPMPIYQHKRLRDVYGSPACSSLFCLEALQTVTSSDTRPKTCAAKRA